MARELMKVFEEIAEEYAATRVRPWEEAYIFNEGPVLDLGSGPGRHTKVMAERGIRVVAADISRRMLKILIDRVSGLGIVDVVVCDMSNLPFRDRSFNGVLFLAAIHHIQGKENRLNVLKQVKRVLKREGLLVISAWALFHGRFLKKIPKMFFDWMVRRTKEFGDTYVPWKSRKGTFMRFYHLFTKRELVNLVRQAGFKIERAYGKSFKSRFLSENHLVVARRIEKWEEDLGSLQAWL